MTIKNNAKTPDVPGVLSSLLAIPAIRHLAEHTQHCLSCADEGVDYAVSRSVLDALTTLGLMEKVSRGKWAPTAAAEQFVAALTESQESISISLEDAEAMGAEGGPINEHERLAFEAWMRGHCWALSATWDGKGYVSDAEQGGFMCARATRTRQLWAAWRDRAALAAQSVGSPSRDPASAQQSTMLDEERAERALKAWFEDDNWRKLIAGIGDPSQFLSRMNDTLLAAGQTDGGKNRGS